MKNISFKRSGILGITALLLAIGITPIHATDIEIKLESNKAESIIISQGQNAVLDLNGKQMTGYILNEGTLRIIDSGSGGKVQTTGSDTIINKGSLTIQGGTFDALTHGKAALFNSPNATATINNGTFIRSAEDGNKNKNSYYAILNKGQMVLNNAKVLQLDTNSASLIATGYANSAEKKPGLRDPSLTINGGFYQGGVCNIKNDEYGNLEINNGEFSNGNQPNIQNWHKAKINGGTFTSNTNSIHNGIYESKGNTDGDLTITGGTFNSDADSIIVKSEAATSPGIFHISGGVYNKEIGKKIGATPQEGYKATLKDMHYYVTLKASSVTLSKNQVSLHTNETITLNATVNPISVMGDVIWESSNKDIATVTNGIVTALKPGTATITASMDGKSSSCIVNVYKIETPVLPTPAPTDDNKTTIQVNETLGTILKDTLKNIVLDIAGSNAVDANTKINLQRALDANESIKIETKLDTIKKQDIKKTDLHKIENALTKDSEVAQYFDLSMLLKSDESGSLGTLNILENKAAFTVSLADKLLKENRTFYIVRLHNGVAERIDGTLNGNEFRFETDKFSLYAIVYDDANVVVPGIVPGKKPPVVTGDPTHMTWLLCSLAVASFVLLLYTFKFKANLKK